MSVGVSVSVSVGLNRFQTIDGQRVMLDITYPFKRASKLVEVGPIQSRSSGPSLVYNPCCIPLLPGWQ